MDIRSQKNKILKSFENNIKDIYKDYIKICRNKGDHVSKKRLDSLSHIEENNLTDIDFILSYHITYLYQMKNTYIAFSFNFPKNPTSEEDFYFKTKVYICTFNESSDNFNAVEMNFIAFEDTVASYLTLQSKINEYELFTSKNGGKDFHMHTFFKNCFFCNNELKLIDYVNQFDSNNKLFIEVLEYQNDFVLERRRINRAKKENKKNKKTIFQSRKNEIQKEINILQRKISELTKEMNELDNDRKGNNIDCSNLNSFRDKFYNKAEILLQEKIKYKGRDHEFIHYLIDVLFKT